MNITQIAIAKNEENNIKKCFGHLKNIVNKQILIDTGSTDKTIDIAEKLGVEIYSIQWENDFSKARNYALSKIPQDTDWVIFLDADEYFDEDSIKTIVPLLEKCKDIKDVDFSGFVMTLTNIDDNGNFISITKTINPRLFKNKGKIQFSYPIHEELLINDAAVRLIPTQPVLNIIHNGYSTKSIKDKNKSNRNYEILIERLKDQPNDPKLLLQLSESLCLEKKFNEAEKYLYQASNCISDDTEDFIIYGIYRNLLTIYFDNNDLDKFLWIFIIASEIDYNFPDWWYLLGNMAYKNNMANLSQMAFKICLECLDKYDKNSEIFTNKIVIDKALKSFREINID